MSELRQKSAAILFMLSLAATWSAPAQAVWGPIACLRAVGSLLFSHRMVPGQHSEAALRELEAGTPAQRAYAAQARRLGAAWVEIKGAVNAELDAFERLGRTARARYLAEVANQLVEALKRKYGVQNIGVHYNMHGGSAVSYLDAGGIRARHPSLPMLNNREHVDLNPVRNSEVYFFQTDHTGLQEILGTTHQDLPVFPFLRMGDTVVLFSLDRLLTAGVRDGIVTHHGTHFMRFDPRRVPEDAIGVPSSDFIVPPIPLFWQIPARLGRYQLSWDGETLAAMRALERVLLP